MEVKLKKPFKNHPTGTVLDVSSRVQRLLEERGVVDRIVLRLDPNKRKARDEKR